LKSGGLMSDINKMFHKAMLKINQQQKRIEYLEQQLKEADRLLKKLNDKQVIKYKEINDYLTKYGE
jgi:hypothetical protein